jgi:hypothetical protein
MTRREIATKSVIVLLSLGCGLPRMRGAADAVEVEVERLTIGEVSSGNVEFERYQLRYDMRLTNRSKIPTVIPTFQPGESVKREIVTLGVEVRQADGTWKDIMGADWFGDSTVKYNPCGILPPGSTTEIKSVTSDIGLRKEQWASLGREMTIRLNLLILCTNPGGKKAADVTTEPFVLRLPDQLH